jgi:Raf kinase inhibitor-like YbhB/YbcL family protein
MEQLLESLIEWQAETQIVQLQVGSHAFRNGNMIPKKYTYEGENINPPLQIGNLPNHTKSMVLIVDELDNSSQLWTHWLVWNIKPSERIYENSVPGVQGLNDFWEHNYEGPCPPKGADKYFFRVYALDCVLNLKASAGREELEAAMKNHVLACGQLMGNYNWHVKG